MSKAINIFNIVYLDHVSFSYYISTVSRIIANCRYLAPASMPFFTPFSQNQYHHYQYYNDCHDYIGQIMVHADRKGKE